MAAEEGFEPSHTESESAVLPLHNSAKLRCPAEHFYYYIHFPRFVKQFLQSFLIRAKKFSTPRNGKKELTKSPLERIMIYAYLLSCLRMCWNR